MTLNHPSGHQYSTPESELDDWLAAARIRRAERAEAKPKPQPATDGPRKKCKDCEKPFPATRKYFYFAKSNGDGLSNQCIVCKLAADKERRRKQSERPAVGAGMQRCNKCGKDKPATLAHFPPAKRSKTGRALTCRHCKCERTRETYQEKKENERCKK